MFSTGRKSKSPLQDVTTTTSSKHKNIKYITPNTPHQTNGGAGAELDAYGELKTKTQMARAFEESQELHKSANDRAGLKTVKTQRVLKKTTTITKGENEKLEATPPVVDNSAELRERIKEYCEYASSLLRWIKKSTIKLEDRNFPKTIRELNELKCENERFKNVDVPPKYEEKQQLAKLAREIYKLADECDVKIDKELNPDNVDCHWQNMMDAHKARDKALDDAIARLKAMEEFNLRLDKIRKALDELDRWLDSMAPVGKDVETLLRQVDEMKKFGSQLERVKADLNALSEFGEELIAKNLVPNPRQLREQLRECQAHLSRIEERANKRLREIEDALKRVEAAKAAEAKFNLRLERLKKELDELERRLDSMAPVGNDLATLQKQLAEMDDFEKRLGSVRHTLDDVVKLGEQLIADGLIANPRALRTALQDCKDQLHRIEQKAAKRLRDIEDALKRLERIKAETDKFNLRLDAIRRQLDELEHRLDSMAPVASDRSTLERQLADMHDFLRRLNNVKLELDAVAELGEDLIRRDLAADPRAMRDAIKDCRAQWARLEARALKRLKDIEEALKKRDAIDKAEAEFDKAAKALAEWLDNAKRVQLAEENVYGDMDTVNALIEQHKAFQQELAAKQPAINEIKRKEQELLSGSPSNAQVIRDTAAGIAQRVRDLERIVRDKSDKLKDAHRSAEQLHNSLHSLLEALAAAETKLRSFSSLPDNEDACKRELAELDKLFDKLGAHTDSKDQILKLARGLLNKCHQDAEPILKHWLNVVETRWEEIDGAVKLRAKRLADHLRLLQQILGTVDELIKYLGAKEKLLLASEAESLPEAVERLDALLNENQKLVDDLRKREPDVDNVVKVFAAKSSSTSRKTVVQTTTTKIADSSETPSSRTSFATYRDEYVDVKHARAKLMLDKWRAVWKLALGKMQSLKDKLQDVVDKDGHGKRQQKPPTDEKLIQNELERHKQVKVYHVGDGKFRFGDSPKLRTIRVLRGKVMVRVDGGWQTVEEFLRKN